MHAFDLFILNLYKKHALFCYTSIEQNASQTVSIL